ncbi:Clp protease N-terminal domain-containing protein [Nonomuraea polychroma]|uniref:Clp protease N-terminal domain-containing protein n=1 Tax=Nonomuraea polychroma TaxID=46176 RepID=UPI003D91DAD8
MRRKKVLLQPLDLLLTQRAAQVLDLAKEEAADQHNYVSTEHLLLGLLRLKVGVGVHALSKLEVNLEAVEGEIEQLVGQGARGSANESTLNPHARQILELSRHEAFELGHRYIGTEHLLLSLIKEGQSDAARVLASFGASYSVTRQKIISVLHGPVPTGWR